MITSQKLIITMDDCQKAGHCATGVRRWFKHQALDFRSFMRQGITAEAMLGTEDAQGRQVVARTIKRRILADQAITEDQAIKMLEAGIDG